MQCFARSCSANVHTGGHTRLRLTAEHYTIEIGRPRFNDAPLARRGNGFPRLTVRRSLASSSLAGGLYKAQPDGDDVDQLVGLFE